MSEPFGSALSVAEFAALSRVGVVPLGAVMGCELHSVYINLPTRLSRPRRPTGSIGYGQRLRGKVFELDELDALVNDARAAALAHLAGEAAALGADAVIGIRQIESDTAQGIWSRLAAHHREEHHLGPRHRRTCDFQLIGTAVRDPALRASAPRLTTLSPTDFCKLREAGWQPAGIVAGCAHKLVAGVRSGVSAAEITGATAVWAGARAKAFEQVTAAMDALGAEGLIGLDVSDEHTICHGREGRTRVSETEVSVNWKEALLVNVNMIGTAIERAPAATTMSSPLRILTLR